MAHSAIMSVRITGNADDAVKAFEKTTTKAAAFGSAIGGLAVKGVTALWDTVKGFTSDVVNMSDSTDKFMNTMSFAGIDTKAVQAAAKETRKYADATVYGLDDIQNTTAQLAANGIGNYMELTEAAGNLNAVAGGNADSFKSVAMMLTQTAGAGKLTTENWNQLADAIPGARYLEIPDAGHLGFIEKPDAVNKAALEFLTEIDGQTIHFVHVRSAHADARPLLLLHRSQCPHRQSLAPMILLSWQRLPLSTPCLRRRTMYLPPKRQLHQSPKRLLRAILASTLQTSRRLSILPT